MEDQVNSEIVEPATSSTLPSPFRVVGIGSSAGGLEALSLLVQHLPVKADAIYVIAQHMSPTHKSVLTALLSRETGLPVVELEPEVTPVVGTIYVTPPNSDVIYEGGKLRLRIPNGHSASPKPSADRLFKSLAEQCGENCVGIVLSGTGSDGSYGVQSIREAGGITIAQEPATAKYDVMPSSAIETGCVDLTMPPEMIGQHFEKILAQPRDLRAAQPMLDETNKLNDLFAILQARTQIDFADYKENTLNRRLARRMNALGIGSYDDYVDHCRSNIEEVDALHRDLLISVTRFFRDPEQFRQLHINLERQFASRPSGPIRIWVAGCATGEEAYSIAILVAECLGGISALTKNKVQIFATDIDQSAIEVARRGLYPLAAAQDIPPHYLKEYFTVGDNEIGVRQELRNVTLFSRHNVFQDPPFINVDLVTIRNVLIYFNLALQERVLTRLHYSMASGGLLFLGTSETVGEMRVFFEAKGNADKIFGKRRGISGEVSIPTSRASYAVERRNAPHRSYNSQSNGGDTSTEEMSLAKAVAPNGMICTRTGEIIEVLGNISTYSEIRAGISTSLNVKMLMDPLRTEAASLIAVAMRNGERRDGRWHDLDLPTGNRIQLQAFPFVSREGGELQCLISINSVFEETRNVNLETISDVDQRAYMERMELEIKSTQEALQQTIEELQTANEELQSANEELQSTNEEFQATNEELETSNEELQSTNEELLTVNEELQISAAERQALASELEATMVSSPYVVALVDQALIIRRLSRTALEFFELKELPPSGIHLSQCDLPLGFPALAPVANSVLRMQEERRIPVLSDGQYYTLILSPVLDVHQKLIGIAITVTRFDNEPLNDILSMAGQISSVGYWTHNLATNEDHFSPAAYNVFGVDANSTELTFNKVMERIHPEDREEMNTKLYDLERDGGSFEFKMRFFDDFGIARRITGKILTLQDTQGESMQLVGSCWDKVKQDEREMLLDSSKNVLDQLEVGMFSIDVQNNVSTWSETLFRNLGLSHLEDVPSAEALLKVIHASDRRAVEAGLLDTLEHGTDFKCKIIVDHPDGANVQGEFFSSAQKTDEGKVSYVFGGLQLYASQ